MEFGFVLTTISACVMIFATVYYAMREVSRAEAAMEVEYGRSEALLANILPATIAARLKDPAHGVIADRYEDASILFADIAGFTERASHMPPAELVRFLDRLYTTFDRLVDKHGLEKIKTTGDSTWWSAAFPSRGLITSKRWPPWRSTSPARSVTCATPPAVRFRSGSVWPPDRWLPASSARAGSSTTCGATRSTSPPGWSPPTRRDAFQVPQDVYERLRDRFELEERGDVEIKGRA